MKLADQDEIRAMQKNPQSSGRITFGCEPSREFLCLPLWGQGVHLCDLEMLGTK